MFKNYNKVILFLYLLGALFLTSCWGGEKRGVSNAENIQTDSLKYAKGVKIEYFKNYTQVSVVNPWDTTKLLQNYILIDRNEPKPENLPAGTIIKVPINNAIVYTSVHTSILEALESVDLIAGVCEVEYIDSKEIKNLVKEGKIADCGVSNTPNIEKIIEKNGEIIIASPFENSNYGQAEKLGIPIFEAADYMENTPLGRAEWVKVYGLLSGRKEMADSIFAVTEKNYNQLKKLANNGEKKPRLLAERKYGSAWFVPAGYSYMGELYTDAGADYIYRKIKKLTAIHSLLSKFLKRVKVRIFGCLSMLWIEILHTTILKLKILYMPN
jgi:ABC-type Fe3+-hydroxamate transport system, periplasmic component